MRAKNHDNTQKQTSTLLVKYYKIAPKRENKIPKKVQINRTTNIP